MRKIAIAMALCLIGVRSYAQFPPAPGTGPGLAETIEAIDSTRVTTRILYVTAHPDDESAAVLTYLARGLHADVALLSLTRGEGGQNALGPEQAPQLGLIRTQELLAATRGYGVKLYFTRAKDFGFSKTPEETEKIWGDQVLEDMVRVIREFRPNIVINNFGGVHTGHGHHQAAGLWTPKAVALAADAAYSPKPYCEFCGTTAAWDGGNLPVRILDLDRGSSPKGYRLPLDEVSSLWGKSWRDLGLDAFSNHRTQGITGFLGSPFLRRPVGVFPEDGRSLDPASLAEPLVQTVQRESSSDCKTPAADSVRIQKIDNYLADARAKSLGLQWNEATIALAEAARLLVAGFKAESEVPRCANGLRSELVETRWKIEAALKLAANLEITATAERNNVAAGENFKLTVTHRCREAAECKFTNLSLAAPNLQGKNVVNQDADLNGTMTVETLAAFINDYNPKKGRSGDTPAIYITQNISIVGYEFTDVVPITFVVSASTHIEKVPVRIVPAYTLAVEPKQAIEKLAAQHKPFDLYLRVHSYSTKAANVAVGLDVPEGWKSSAAVELSFTGEGDRYAKLILTPPAKLAAGHYTITAFAKRGEEKFTTSIEPLVSMPTLVWEEPAQTVVHAFDIKVPENLRVGYISAESEPVPDALKMLGIRVEMLDANTLNFGDLSKYDALVVGVRAYELRSELPGANQRLLDYAKNGGTLVVQYQREFAWDGKNYAPYPAKIASKQGDPLPRITDENSPVKFLKADDALLNTPNKIAQEDFKGWVQERGLYFWSEYDPHYTALLAMNDPGEKDLEGGLVYTKLGKGTYTYTGIAFFRQLPEGVPGAYRLFVNLLSASRSH